MESSLQNSLSYILVQMVHAKYCAPYPKWPYIKHEANMWCPYYMILLCSRTFYSLLSSFVINIVTTPLDVTDVTVWQITSNPNSRVLKIEKCKIIKIKMKNKNKIKIKSIILYSYIISYLRFFLWRNVPFSSLFHLFPSFLLSLSLLFSSSICSYQFVYHPSTTSNFSSMSCY